MGNIGNHIKRHKVRYSILFVMLAIACILYFTVGMTYIRRHFHTVSINRAQATKAEHVDMGEKNGIIIYFTRVGNTDFEQDVDAVSSASLMVENGTLIGNSELLAEMIANATDFETYAITTKKKYSSSYNDTVMEAREEMGNQTRSEFSEPLPELDAYDHIIMVYPLWWGTLPMPVQTFLSETDLTGKTIYSVVTHGGSEFGRALEDTKNYTKATVSDHALAVYDDDVVTSLPLVMEWLKKVQ